MLNYLVCQKTAFHNRYKFFSAITLIFYIIIESLFTEHMRYILLSTCRYFSYDILKHHYFLLSHTALLYGFPVYFMYQAHSGIFFFFNKEALKNEEGKFKEP